MAKAITTKASIVFVDQQGMLHVVSNGTPSTGDTVLETFAVAQTLVDHPVPTLFDARDWPIGGSDFWLTFIEVLPLVTSAGAILVRPDAEAALGQFPKAVNRLMVPFGVFTEESDAIEFLQRFVIERTESEPEPHR